jgi:hypothetical protein
VEQQVDVLEQELAALGHRDLARRLAARQRRRLLEDPRVAQRAAADEHARHPALPQLLDQLRGSTQSPLPSTGIPTVRRDASISAQSDEPSRTAPPCARARRSPRRPRLPSARPARAR